MPANIRESGLEDIIVQHLLTANGYEQGSNEDYCREYAIDETRLFRFLSETPAGRMEQGRRGKRERQGEVFKPASR